MPTDHPVASMQSKVWRYASLDLSVGDDTASTVDIGDGSPKHGPIDGLFTYFRDEADYPNPAYVQPTLDAFDPVYQETDGPTFWAWRNPPGGHIFEELYPSGGGSHKQPLPSEMTDLGYFNDARVGDLGWGGGGVPTPEHPQTFAVDAEASPVAEHAFYYGNVGFESSKLHQATFYHQHPFTGLTFDFDRDTIPITGVINIHWKVVVSGANCLSSVTMFGGQKNYTRTQIGSVETIEFDALSNTQANNDVRVYVGAADQHYNDPAVEIMTPYVVSEGAFLVGSITAERTWTMEDEDLPTFHIHALPNPVVAGQTVTLYADVYEPLLESV